MFRPIRAALLVLFAALAPAAHAQGMEMSDAEREAFRAEVRAYLLDNPEVIFEAVAEFERRTAAAQNDMDATLVELNHDALFNDGFSWIGGNPDGDITLVEFSDYRCSFCRRAFDEVMTLLDLDGNIRFVLKELPILGPQSELAARFAIAVHQMSGDDAYFAVHQGLMEFRGDITPNTLGRFAGEVGLDWAEVEARMQSPEVSRVITENRALAGRLQVSGTPTFVLEDEMLRGYLPLEQLLERVEAARG